jgi:hypothetical protein
LRDKFLHAALSAGGEDKEVLGWLGVPTETAR